MRIEHPGFFDLQVNGFAGVDFNNPDADSSDILCAIEKLRATGVTAFLPTLITASFDRFRVCAQQLLRLQCAAVVGLHMEGPYISSEDGPRGAHPRRYVIEATRDDFLRRQDAAEGRILLVTLAPEVPGAIQLIEYLVSAGIRVAIGHSAATTEQISDAVKAGATLSTHLGNGCHLQMPRHPNLIWEQLAEDRLFASLIVDGHHLPPATVKAMICAKGIGRTILTTDAMAAAGCGPGNFQLNGETVVVNDAGRVSPPGKPWLAGSSLTMNRAVANTVKFARISLETAWRMASINPATFFGLKTTGRVIGEWDDNSFQLTIREVVT
ncbi:MAG: amidohydrolase family protein [Verrucomicrobiota bacterium]